MLSTNNLPYCALTIGHKDKYIEEAVHLTLLDIQIDNHRNWKNHSDQIIPKLSAAFFMFVLCINSIKALFYYSKLMHTIIKS